MGAIRILLAEDHKLVRAGIRALLEDIHEVEVVGETGSGLEAITLAASLSPDILLIDVGLPELNGLDVTARLHKEKPRVRVIILSAYTDHSYVRKAFEVGASAYLIKGADLSELELALRAVMRGESYLSPAVSGSMIGGYLRGEGPAATEPGSLSQRQREVLQLVAEGCSTKEIAQRLDISIKTVESHRSELMKRLDIHDVAGLVRYAIRTGIVSAEG